MNPTVILAVLLGWALTIIGAGWYAMDLGYDKHVAEIAAQRESDEKVRKEALDAAAREVAKIDVKQVTIQGKVIERIRTETIYTECRHSPDTMKMIEEAFKP